MSLRNLIVRIFGDKTQLESTLKGAEGSISRFGTAIKRLGSMLAAAFSVTAIIGFTKKSLELYDVQARAERSLLVALKGREDIQKNLIKVAKQLQQVTLFGDEETVQAAARLAMLIGANESAIKKLLPLVQDLASAKFEGNLATAADLVGKSIGSSTNALTRYGIEIVGAVGSVERLTSAMEGLNRQVGGQAKAAAEVGMGAFKQLKNIISDLQESIGQKMIDTNWFKNLTAWGRDFVKIASEKGFLKAIPLAWFADKKTIAEIEKAESVIEPIIEGTKEYKKTIADLREEITAYEADIENASVADINFIQTTLKKIQALKKEIEVLTTLKIVREKGPGIVPTGHLTIPALRGELEGLAGAPETIIPIKTIEELTKGLLTQNDAVNILANSFEELFSKTGKGFQGMIDNMLAALNRLLAEMVAKAVLWTILNIITGGTAGTFKAFMGFGNTLTAGGAAGAKSAVPIGSIPATAFPGGDIRLSVYGKDLMTILRRNEMG